MFNKILIIKLRHIGDVLLTTPVFKILKENFPNSYIAALVNKGTEAILEGNPYLDEIISFDRNIKDLKNFKKYLEQIKFLKEIRKKEFDTTIDLTGGDRAAIISYISDAKIRFGIKSGGFMGKSLLYNNVFEIDRTKHAMLQNIKILEKMGLNIKNPRIELYVSENEKAQLKNLIFKNFFVSPLSDNYRILNQKLVHIHPTSRWLFKCWKDEYMAEVIKWLISHGYRIIISSSSEEKELKKIESILSHINPSLICEPNVELISNSLVSHLSQNDLKLKQKQKIIKDFSPILNLAGKLNLRQLIAVSSISDIYFGIDTAPMHISAALGKPVVALFGPSGAFNWGPWDNDEIEQEPYTKRNGVQRFGKNTVIQRDWNCIPCGKDGCKGSKISNCIFDITPKEVTEILEEELKKLKNANHTSY